MPGLYIITGSNGAGKSSVGSSYFPEQMTNVFDGDKRFLEEKSRLWKSGLKVQKELNRKASEFVDQVFLSLAEQALNDNKDFAYEGHFSEDESWQIIARFKKSGYSIHLVFLGLRSPELSSNRVLIRATEGGHNVDELTLRNNFYGNLLQLNGRFKIFDTVLIVDTSEMEHCELVRIGAGKIVNALPKQNMPEWAVTSLPDIVKMIPD